MQFSQIIAVFALAVATSALPQSLSFDETMAKIKLAHPGISDDDAHTQAVGFLDAIAKLQVEGTPRVSYRAANFPSPS